MLSHLNDDCLLQIFQLLPLKDQLQLTEISERFQFLIVKYIWSKKYTKLNTRMRCLHSLSLQQYMLFFQLNQANIRKLKIDISNNFAYVYNSNRLSNRPDYTFYFSLKMPKLEILCLNSPNACRIHDDYIEMLSKYSTKLEILDLGKSLVSGAYIEDMKSLKSMTTDSKLYAKPLSELEEYFFK